MDKYIKHCLNPQCTSFIQRNLNLPVDYKSRGEKLLYGVSPLKETFHSYIFFGGEEEDGHLRSLPHLLAKAEAEPSARETSGTGRSYGPAAHKVSASARVQPPSVRNPAFPRQRSVR